MIRSALKLYLDKLRANYLARLATVAPQTAQARQGEICQVKVDLEHYRGDFSFNKMLTVFTGCVSVRSLEGLVRNTIQSNRHITRQTQSLANALERLTCRTIAQEQPGWRMISPLVQLIQKYQVDPKKMKLEMSTFPLDATIQQSFFQDGNVLGTIVYNAHDYFRSGGSACAHACVIISVDPKTREFVIKNSYNAEHIIRVPEVYNTHAFDNNPAAFRAKYTAITQDDYLMYPGGMHLKFETI